MATVVIKRDGCRVPFDARRIEAAVQAAAQAARVDDGRCDGRSAGQRAAGNPAEVDIRDIQCAVEEALMSGRWPQLARAYIEYRHDRDLAREQRKLHHAIRGGGTDQRGAAQRKRQQRQQSDPDAARRAGRHRGQTLCPAALLPRDVVLAHERGEIHYHDLDYSPSSRCLTAC